MLRPALAAAAEFAAAVGGACRAAGAANVVDAATAALPDSPRGCPTRPRVCDGRARSGVHRTVRQRHRDAECRHRRRRVPRRVRLRGSGGSGVGVRPVDDLAVDGSGCVEVQVAVVGVEPEAVEAVAGE